MKAISHVPYMCMCICVYRCVDVCVSLNLNIALMLSGVLSSFGQVFSATI